MSGETVDKKRPHTNTLLRIFVTSSERVPKHCTSSPHFLCRGRSWLTGALCALCSGFLLVWSSMAPGPAYGADQPKKPEISELEIMATSDALLVFATLTNGFIDTMRQGIKNGIPVTFTFLLECEQLTPTGAYTKLITTSATHRISYDSLKGVYLVEKNTRKGSPESFSSLDVAEKEMSQVNGLYLLPLSDLNGTTLKVRMKVELVKKTLPLKLHVILPFFALWDFETSWKTTQFQLKLYDGQ